jgi:hypothetical protein
MSERSLSEFHAHLDECEQCEKHPWDLCEVGAKLLTTEPLTVVHFAFDKEQP